MRWCGRYKIVKQDDQTFRVYKRCGKRWVDCNEQFLIYDDAKRLIEQRIKEEKRDEKA